MRRIVIILFFLLIGQSVSSMYRITGLPQRRLLPKSFVKKPTRFYARKLSNIRLPVSQKLRTFFHLLRFQHIASLFFSKQQVHHPGLSKVIEAKPIFDVEKIHLTIDLSKPIQDIQNELRLYSENYRGKNSWGQFSVTFKANGREIALHADHSQGDYILQIVFSNLIKFVTKNYPVLRKRLQTGTQELVGFDVDLLITFQRCFNPLYPY